MWSGVRPGWCCVVLLSIIADRKQTTPATAARARCSPGTHVRILPRGVVRPALGCQGRDRRRALSSIPANVQQPSSRVKFHQLHVILHDICPSGDRTEACSIDGNLCQAPSVSAGTRSSTLRPFGTSGEVVVVPCQVRLGVSVKAGRCLLAPGAGVLVLKGRSDCPSFWPSLLSALAPLATTPPHPSLYYTRSRVYSLSRLIFPRELCAVIKRIESGCGSSLNKRAFSTLRYCQVPRTTSAYSSIQLHPTPSKAASKMEQTVAEAVAAATQQQQAAAQQAQQLISQPSPPVQPVQNASSTIDNLTCQWQGCGERCDSAEALYVSNLSIRQRCCRREKPCVHRVAVFSRGERVLSSSQHTSDANDTSRTTYANATSVARAPTTST